MRHRHFITVLLQHRYHGSATATTLRCKECPSIVPISNIADCPASRHCHVHVADMPLQRSHRRRNDAGVTRKHITCFNRCR